MNTARIATGLSCLLLGFWVVALPARAQTPSSPGTAATARLAVAAAEEDRELLEDMAHASLAGMEAGRLALEKSRNASVRQFAQQMIDDHQSALQALGPLARNKQMSLPTEADFQHKSIAAALRLLTGGFFDRQFIRQVGIKDTKRTIDLLQKMQSGRRDPEFKAYADPMLPVLQGHLAQARELDRQFH